MRNDVYHSCYKGYTENSDVKKAMALELDIVSQIMIDMESDTENQSAMLLELYLNADEEEKGMLDYLLVSLCGYTLKTIINNAAAAGLVLDC